MLIGNRYEVIKKLGEGGMGEVHLAQDNATGRQVAVKMAFTDIRSPQVSKLRFKREVQILRTLNNPYVVKVLDEGVQGESQYYVMEYIEGPTFSFDGDYIEFAKLLQNVASGLYAVHVNGVVHRDIKPQNVIVCGGRAMIVDFGIALLSDSERLTRTGAMVGTIAYMSPEQVMGLRIDGRSDLYSLGVVAYELLAGANPFDGDNLVHVIFKILHERPKRLSEIRRDIPPALESICQKLLEKNPDLRYQSAKELLGDLESFILGESVQRRAAPLLSWENVPFIGRQTLIEKFRGLVDLAKIGFGQSVVVVGDDGSGKSRLLDEFRSYSLSRGLRFLTCDPKDARSGVPAISVVMDQLATFDVTVEKRQLDLHAKLIRYLSQSFADRWHLDSDAPDIEDWNIAPKIIGDIILGAFADENAVFAFDEPSDVFTKAIMERISEVIKDRKFVMVVTSKSQPTFDGPIVLELPPFGFDDLALLAEFVARKRLDEDQLKSLELMSHGNPSIAIEILKAVANQTKETKTLPADPTEILSASFSKLSQPSRKLIQKASLIGKPLPPQDLQAITRMSEIQLTESLAELQKYGFIRERLKGIDLVVEVAPDKLEKVIDDSLPPDERRYLHQDIAVSLEVISAGTTDVYDEDIGSHFIEAGEINKGCHYLLKAAMAAQKRGHTTRYHEILKRIQSLQDGISDKEVLAEALINLTNMFLGTGSTELAKRFLGRLEAALEGMDFPLGKLARGYSILIRSKAMQGTFDEAKELIKKANARLGQRCSLEDTFLITQAEAYVASLEKNLEDSQRAGQKMLILAKQMNDQLHLISALNVLAIYAALTHNNREAVELFEQICTLSEQIGHERGAIVAKINMSAALFDLGEEKKAKEALRTAKGRAFELGLTAIGIGALSNLAFFYKKTGEIGLFEAALDQWETMLAKSKSNAYADQLYKEKTRLHLAKGDLDMARAEILKLERASPAEKEELFVQYLSVSADLAFLLDGQKVAIHKYQDVSSRYLKLPSFPREQAMTLAKLAGCQALLYDHKGASESLKRAQDVFSKSKLSLSERFKCRFDTYRAFVLWKQSSSQRGLGSIKMLGSSKVFGEAFDAISNVYKKSKENYLGFFLGEVVWIYASMVKEKLETQKNLDETDKVILTITAKMALDDAYGDMEKTGFSLYKDKLMELSEFFAEH